MPKRRSNPIPPALGEELYLYLASSTTATSSTLVCDYGKALQPVYFASHVYTDVETRYADIEKIMLALVHASRKMQPYFQAHRIIMLTQHLLRQILGQPIRSPRVVKWALELAEFDIQYHPRTAIKVQVLPDFLGDFAPLPPTTEMWELFIDGSFSSTGAGVGVILKSPKEIIAQHAVKLLFAATNNEAEYETLLSSLRVAQMHKARRVTIHTDSQLVTWQTSGSYQAKEPCIAAYLE